MNSIRKRKSSALILLSKYFSSNELIHNKQIDSPDDQSSFSTENNNSLSLETKSALKFFLAGNRVLNPNDYNKSSLILARYLLGKILVRVDNGEALKGRIVETEAYLGETDPACHSYGGKRTSRTIPMYMNPGTTYIFTIYGLYYCLNVSSADKGGCVLIRALEPIEGEHKMKSHRSTHRKAGSPTLTSHQLCNGPSKLCQALNITKSNLNAVDLSSSNVFYVTDDGYVAECIISCKRIGIDGYGKESAEKEYRFYLRSNKCVSKRDRLKESS